MADSKDLVASMERSGFEHDDALLIVTISSAAAAAAVQSVAAVIKTSDLDAAGMSYAYTMARVIILGLLDTNFEKMIAPMLDVEKSKFQPANDQGR